MTAACEEDSHRRSVLVKINLQHVQRIAEYKHPPAQFKINHLLSPAKRNSHQSISSSFNTAILQLQFGQVHFLVRPTRAFLSALTDSLSRRLLSFVGLLDQLLALRDGNVEED